MRNFGLVVWANLLSFVLLVSNFNLSFSNQSISMHDSKPFLFCSTCFVLWGTTLLTELFFAQQIRDERKQAVEDHVKNVEAILKEAQVAGLGSGDEKNEADETATNLEPGGEQDDNEWDGFEDPAPSAPAIEPVDHEEEYIDEDLYTTVKIEAVSVDRDGLHNKAELEAEEDDDEEGGKGDQAGIQASGGKKGRNDLPKKKKKKFRYESKLDRQLTNRKNKAKKAR